jgi:gentisate 1,2-dioxygenase
MIVIDERYREWNRDHKTIRQHGAVGSLCRGIEITVHGMPSRLIAWPGNGYQTESVHVVTLEPGQSSDLYTYDMAEEAFLCILGSGEMYVRGQWVGIAPGDLAFIPAAVPRAVRNPAANSDQLILVNQITPPQFDVYAADGFYDRKHKVMNFEAIEAAKLTARQVELPPATEVKMRETHPEVRPWNLDVAEIRQGGALFNVMKGASFGELGTPMLLVLWPGYGVRSAGLHMGGTPAGARASIHTHPDSDECLFNWIGDGEVYCEGEWMPSHAYDVLLAPCGVHHSVGGSRNLGDGPSFGCGYASPPQLDLYIDSPFFQSGTFTAPPWTVLSNAPQE